MLLENRAKSKAVSSVFESNSDCLFLLGLNVKFYIPAEINCSRIQKINTLCPNIYDNPLANAIYFNVSKRQLD